MQVFSLFLRESKAPGLLSVNLTAILMCKLRSGYLTRACSWWSVQERDRAVLREQEASSLQQVLQCMSRLRVNWNDSVVSWSLSEFRSVQWQQRVDTKWPPAKSPCSVCCVSVQTCRPTGDARGRRRICRMQRLCLCIICKPFCELSDWEHVAAIC